MKNFVKIPCQMKEFSIQKLGDDRSVCMAVRCLSNPILAFLTNEQLFRAKRMWAKLQTDISKTDELIRGTQAGKAKSSQLITLIIYISIRYTLEILRSFIISVIKFVANFIQTGQGILKNIFKLHKNPEKRQSAYCR